MESQLLETLKQSLLKALEENDTKAVDHHHLFMQYVETNALIKFVGELNIASLRSTMNYLSGKLQYLQSELNKYEN